MTHTTVLIILDAGRDDYLGRETMPFLTGLAEGALTGAVESPPGFAQRTVLFTGRYPDTSGNFSAFVFDPDNSPFAWVDRLGPLKHAVQPWRVLVPARMAIRKITGWLTDAYHTDPAWIPPRYLPYFRPCEDTQPVYDPGALGAPSIFDLLRDQDRSFRYLAHPVSGDDEEVENTLVRELRRGEPTDLYIAQFSATDELGHKYGPHSDEMDQEVLPRVDRRLASVHAALTAGYDSWDLIVLGDHGMAPVEERVDVLDHLGQADASPGEDYVVFVNSTMAVLWYLTERGRREVEAVLDDIPGSYPLDEDDRARLRIPITERWGHRMVAAEPGVLFWPDYFHVRDSTIRGMHGYLDKSTETYGLLALASSRDLSLDRDVGVRSLVDIFPTLCDLLDLPLPETQEGTSLLAAEQATDPSPPPPARDERAREAPEGRG